VHEVEVRALHALLLAEALVVELDEIFVLAVHHHQAARRRHLLHRVEDAAEVDAIARALGMGRQHVGGEDLEGRKALLYGFGDLLEDAQRERAGQRDVEGVVDVGVALPPRRPPLHHRHHVAHVGAHVGEVDVRGRAAARHALGVLLGPQRLRRLLRVRHDRVREMGVGLHAARRDDLAGRVDDPRRARRQRPRRGNGGDTLAFHRDIPEAHALGSDHLSTANHEIECHGSSSSRETLHAEIRALDVLVAEQVGAAAFQHHAAIFQDIAAPGQPQRLPSILLHEEHRGARHD
jgi:hypothetical protein